MTACAALALLLGCGGHASEGPLPSPSPASTETPARAEASEVETAPPQRAGDAARDTEEADTEEADATEPARSPAIDAEARAMLRAVRWPDPSRASARPRTCSVVDFVVEEGAPHAESFAVHHLDRRGLEVRTLWNSDAVGLSGEIRHRYDRAGERTRTVEIPFETIEDGPPTRPAPIRYRYERAPGQVTATTVRDGEVLRTERWRFDAAGRVLERASEDDAGESRVERCELDHRGRLAARTLEWRDAPVRTELVYEDGRVVALRRTIGDGPPAEESVWAIDGGFVVVGGEQLTRYVGDCQAYLLEPCDPRLAPLPAEGGERATPPTRTIGRPLEDTPAPLLERLHPVERLGDRTFAVLPVSGSVLEDADPEIEPAEYLSVTPRRGRIPDRVTVLGESGTCEARVLGAVEVAQVRDHWDELPGGEEPRPRVERVSFDALEIDAPCDGVLAIEGEVGDARWLPATVDQEFEFALANEAGHFDETWRYVAHRGPPQDEICPDLPTFRIFRGDTRVGTIARGELRALGLLLLDGSPHLVVDDLYERVVLGMRGGFVWRRELASRIHEDAEASPCL